MYGRKAIIEVVEIGEPNPLAFDLGTRSPGNLPPRGDLNGLRIQCSGVSL